MRLPGKRIALYGGVFVLLLVVFAYLLVTYTRRVDGTSMYPTLEGGDLVVIQPVSMSDVHIGDVIVYTPPCSGEGFSVIHRVVGGTPDQGFKTQGDNNPLPDQDSGIARTPIRQDCLVGKVVFVVPYVETLASLPYGVNYLLAFLIFLVIIVSEFGRRRVSEGGPPDANSENPASELGSLRRRSPKSSPRKVPSDECFQLIATHPDSSVPKNQSPSKNHWNGLT